MRGLTAFLKKEFCEMIRTYKVLILGAVFFVLGVTGPITAKYMPELMENFLPEGMVLTLETPKAIDSWMQFFKNVPQIGIIIVVIVFGGMMASEWSKGTLILVLTKGLPRRNVILAKFITAVSMWTAAYWLCFGISYGYTRYFWDEQTPRLGAAVAFVWVFGMMLIAVTLLGGVIFKGSYMALLFTGFLVVMLFLLNIFPAVQEYNPVMLLTSGMELLEGTKKPGDFTVPAVITAVAAIASLIGSIVIFDKKQL